MIFKFKKTKGVTPRKHTKNCATPLTNIKKGEIDMCDTKIKINQKCDINKLMFFACDILPAYTSCVWYLKGD